MSKIQVEVSKEIGASPEQIYGVLSDYHAGHPHILPPQYFKKLSVLEGGKGAGTVIDISMKVMGMHRLLNPPVMRRIYQDELDLLAGYVQTKNLA